MIIVRRLRPSERLGGVDELSIVHSCDGATYGYPRALSCCLLWHWVTTPVHRNFQETVAHSENQGLDRPRAARQNWRA
jgi:hypothetical protein